MRMRRIIRWSLSTLLISTVLWGSSTEAQVSDVQVEALVEALRRAAPQTGTENDGLYSDWQILPANIPRWSRQCIGRELTPAQFEASPTTARSILVCTMRDVLRDEYRTSGNNETVAVRRAAAWWMTGNPNRYTDDRTAFYTQKVLSFYQQQVRPTSAARPVRQESNYDRYMQTGYAAVNKKDYQAALVNFRKALKERPNDSYATLAALNVETYIKRDRAASPSPSPSPSPGQSQPSPSAASITQEQAVSLITEWLQAKQQVFAPPFNRQPIVELTTGELYTDLDRSDGPIAWLKSNNAYYRFGVQKVEGVDQFVANGNKASMEVRVIEDRTLYRNGQIDLRQTDFETKTIRYSLQQSADGKWKIADYKTSNGSVLERTVAN